MSPKVQGPVVLGLGITNRVLLLPAVIDQSKAWNVMMKIGISSYAPPRESRLMYRGKRLPRAPRG